MITMFSKKHPYSQKYGFTLVEILIVVSIIGILATILVVWHTNARTKGKATAIVASLKSLEKGLQAYAVASESSRWWLETTFAATPEPRIEEMVAAFPEMTPYIGTTSPVYDGYTIGYDNDGDRADAGVVQCGLLGEETQGVNLRIRIPNDAVRAEVDRIIDPFPHALCGKARIVNNLYIFYKLGADSQDFLYK